MAYVKGIILQISEAGAGTVSKETEYLFDIRGLISRETSYLFDIRSPISRETSYLFDLYNTVSKETSYLFDIRGFISKEMVYKFDLGFVPVGIETSYPFDLFNSIAKETSYAFDIYNAVARETAYIFDIALPAKETSYVFDLLNLVSRETSYPFMLRNLAPPKETEYLFDIFKGSERIYVVDGKTPFERDYVIHGYDGDSIERYYLIHGVDESYGEKDYILEGKQLLDRDYIISGRPQSERGYILNAYEILPAGRTRRLMLLDTLNLRTTSVYKTPRDISVLKICYGDLTGSRVSCTPLDKDGKIFHVSDKPMQIISKVFVEDEPKTYGFRAYAAYQDETGHSIACVVFDNPQYDKRVSISGKGAINLETGDLIENPADFIKDVFLNIQGYCVTSIDLAEISRFYADCLREDIKVADVLDEIKTIKSFLDDLAMNIHAHWVLSDGKSVMRLRWL